MNFYKKAIGLSMIIVMVLSMLIPFGFAEEVNNPQAKYKEGVVIVQFEDSLKAEEKAKHREELGLSLKKEFKKKGLELLKINGKKSVEEVIEKLSKKKGVAFVEPDYVYYPSEIPNDEYFDLLWGLENGRDNDIDATEAWDIQKGNGIIVAVIDTGIQTSHPDLAGQFVEGYDFYEDNDSVYDGPDDDHGTHVAGTIAAIANNSIGVVGVAPEVKIMPLKFLGPDGGYTSDAIEAINFARDNGAHVINASWGGGGESAALKEAIKLFGGPFVAAAGNDRTDTDRFAHYPSSYTYENPADDRIISVAAIDSKGRLARFSNYGDMTVDVGAPGVDIASTYPDGYAYMGGTSMAAPHVAGIAALMLAEDNALSANELINVLYDTSVPLTSLSGKTVTGGLVNANLALEALDGTITNTAPSVTITGPSDGTAVDSGASLVFAGTAIDTEDGDISASLTWDSSIDGLIWTGASFSTTTLSVGIHEITAFVTDSGGLVGSDSITVTINSTEPTNTIPTVVITSPADDTNVESGTLLTFTGTASDTEDGSLTTELSWESDLDGVIGTGNTFNKVLSVGTHNITASVADSGGLTGSDSVTVVIEPVPPVTGLISNVTYDYWQHPKKGYGNVTAIIEVTSDGVPVAGITVNGDWIYNENVLGSETGITGDNGTISFTLSKVTPDAGDTLEDYTFEVDPLIP